MIMNEPGLVRREFRGVLSISSNGSPELESPVIEILLGIRKLILLKNIACVVTCWHAKLRKLYHTSCMVTYMSMSHPSAWLQSRH